MSGATTALDAAIADWNSRISSTGIEFERVSSSCGGGPSCISVTTAQQSSCGYAYKEWDATGLITGNASLRIRDDWATLYSAQGLQRMFVHELGHFVGMDNSNPAACGISDVVMQDQFDCTAASVMHTASINDYLPVTNTAYGGMPKTTCGF